MATIRCPEIDPELIEYLKHVFPDRAVDPDRINPHRAFGNAEVVRHLERVAEEQKENPDVFIL